MSHLYSLTFVRQNIKIITEHVKRLFRSGLSGARDEDKDPCQNNSGRREVTQPCVTSVRGGSHIKIHLIKDTGEDIRAPHLPSETHSTPGKYILSPSSGKYFGFASVASEKVLRLAWSKLWSPGDRSS